MRLPRHIALMLGLTSLAFISLAWALLAGSSVAGWQDVWPALNGGGGTAGEVIRTLRLPRALAAFACGGLLALSGALLQILLRNPLADPYVLGVSGGASLAALLALAAGWSGWAMQGSAFVGALIAMLLVFALAHRRGPWSSTRMLLTGVMVASLCSACIALILSLAPDANLRGMLYWLMGDASQAEHPLIALSVLLLGVTITLPLARELNLLARGDISARALGVNVSHLSRWVFVLTSLMTAIAVTTIGAVGFVGLAVPHVTRFLLGHDQRIVLPASVLLGGSLLTCADTLARTLLDPVQLPVGVFMALIGAPLFLWLLSRRFA